MTIAKNYCSAGFIAICATVLLSGCATKPATLGQDVVPLAAALPQLPDFVGQRISVSGIPRQNQGRCKGLQPLSKQDWMLTDEDDACLWINGHSDQTRLTDFRPTTRKDVITVTGELIQTDRGILVLKLPAPKLQATTREK